jgi:hypothetical protein
VVETAAATDFFKKRAGKATGEGLKSFFAPCLRPHPNRKTRSGSRSQSPMMGPASFSGQGFDEILKRAHVHIRVALEPGRRKLTNFATRHRLVILSLTLLPGHGVECGCFLLHVLAAALRAFRVSFVFFQGENQFEGFVTIVANVVVHGHGGLLLDCDHELRFEL